MISRLLSDLKKELETDPLNLGYSSMTNEEKITTLNTKDFVTYNEFWVTDRTLDHVFGLQRSLEIVGALKYGAEQGDALSQRALELLIDRAGKGLDIGSQTSQQAMQMLVIAGIMTQDEADKLRKLGTKMCSVFNLIGYDVEVTEAMIKEIYG